jgi:hypothetical protein
VSSFIIQSIIVSLAYDLGCQRIGIRSGFRGLAAPANHSGCHHDPASGPDSVAELPVAFGGIPMLTDDGF